MAVVFVVAVGWGFIFLVVFVVVVVFLLTLCLKTLSKVGPVVFFQAFQLPSVNLVTDFLNSLKKGLC